MASAYQSYPDYLDFRHRNRSFKDLAAYNIVQAGLDTGESPSRAWLLAVSGNLLRCARYPSASWPFLQRLGRAGCEQLQTWDQGLNLVLFPPRVATVVLGVLGLMASCCP